MHERERETEHEREKETEHEREREREQEREIASERERDYESTYAQQDSLSLGLLQLLARESCYKKNPQK